MLLKNLIDPFRPIHAKPPNTLVRFMRWCLAGSQRVLFSAGVVSAMSGVTEVATAVFLGKIIDSLDGTIIHEFIAPCDGMITCCYNNALIYENAVAFRVAKIG